MKQVLSLFLIFALTISFALATTVIEETYSDAPGNPTHENVIDITAQALIPDENPQPYSLIQILSTPLTIEKLGEIFDFVDITTNPPARYFPEEVQRQLDEILEPTGVDKDWLYMPEFMSLMPQVFEQEARVDVEMLLDITYNPGRLVVVVLGWETSDGVVWRALEAEVPVQDTIHFVIPKDVLEQINGQETLFALLTIKPGAGGEAGEGGNLKPQFVPSKSASDLTSVENVYSSDGSALPEDCEIIIVDPSREIEIELGWIENHLVDDRRPIIAYFDRQTSRQAQLLLPRGVDADTLVAYETTCVQIVNYIEPYGDVMAEFSFVTPYEYDQPMVCLLGLPDEEFDGEFVWTPLHTEITNAETELVEITFSSTVLPTMMEKPALLLVLSTPLD